MNGWAGEKNNKKYQPSVFLNYFSFDYIGKKWAVGLGIIFHLNSYSVFGIMWFIMYHYNKTQLLYITGVTQRKWIFLWVPVIVKRMIADSENVLYNNPV